jgi:hypothetical protein
MIRAIIRVFVISIITVFMVQCESSLPGDPVNNDHSDTIQNPNLSGSVINASDCKQFKAGNFAEELTDTLSCIEFIFNADSKSLLLLHQNAGFNCCPGSLSCSVNLSGDTLIIQEYEEEALCNCNCLYDLEIKVNGVEAKIYQLKFIEPYVWDMDKLEFEINLTTDVSGLHCVTRKKYPWGIHHNMVESSEITGKILNYSDCKDLSISVAMAKDAATGESCLEYSFSPETGTLLLKHINAGFNCCPEGIDCLITSSNDTIYIEETEAGGLCACLCLYDLDIELEGLESKGYFIKLKEPYLDQDEKLELWLDLQNNPSGNYCVTRNDYPWGL